MKSPIMLSRLQMFALLSSSYFPLAFWVFPRVAVESADTDAQWSILGLIFVSLIMAWVHGRLNQRFPGMLGPDMATRIFGRFLGAVTNWAYLPLYLLFVSLSMYQFEMTLRPYLPDTPTFVLLGALSLVAAVGAWYGLESLARVSTIIFPLMWLGVLATFVTILIQSTWYGMPTRLVSPSRAVWGVYELLPLYLGFNMFLMLSPYYPHKKGLSMWSPVLNVTLGAVAVVIVFLATTMVVGWEGILQLTYPTTFVVRLVRFHGLVIERVGIVLVLMSTAYSTLFVSNHLWCLSTLTARMYRLPDSYNKRFIVPIAVTFMCVVMWFRNEQQVFDVLRIVLVPTSWILLLLLPVLMLVVSILRGIRQPSE